MDTDDLSIPTYKGIIIEAENFNHDLTLQFGVLASRCIDDNDYLDKAEILIQEWLDVEDYEDIIDDIFFGEYVDPGKFLETLHKISANIIEIRKTPIENRIFEE